jgi:hypothetical protein
MIPPTDAFAAEFPNGKAARRSRRHNAALDRMTIQSGVIGRSFIFGTRAAACYFSKAFFLLAAGIRSAQVAKRVQSPPPLSLLPLAT